MVPTKMAVCANNVALRNLCNKSVPGHGIVIDSLADREKFRCLIAMMKNQDDRVWFFAIKARVRFFVSLDICRFSTAIGTANCQPAKHFCWCWAVNSHLDKSWLWLDISTKPSFRFAYRYAVHRESLHPSSLLAPYGICRKSTPSKSAYLNRVDFVLQCSMGRSRDLQRHHFSERFAICPSPTSP